MSEPQPEPGDLTGSEERTAPKPDSAQRYDAQRYDAQRYDAQRYDAQRYDAQPGDAQPGDIAAGDTQPERARPADAPWFRAPGDNATKWLPPAAPGAPHSGFWPGGGHAGESYASGGYPGGGYPGGGYPGGGYPGSGYPGAGYPGSGYPGAGYPGSWQGGGYRGGRRGPARGTAALVAIVALVAAGFGAGIAYLVNGAAASSSIAGSTPSGSGSGVPGSGSGVQPQAPNGVPGNPFGGQQPGATTPGATTPGAGAPSDVSGIAAKVSPALVDVNVTFSYQNAAGAGTGIVLTSTGEVLTNNHVIDGATSISVVDIGNGRTYGATVVGYDSTHDIAVLQLSGASGLQTAVISQSAPTVGEGVVAIGNAGGSGGTPSASGGSVTALDQSIDASDSLDGTTEQLSGLIETNADVQAGDSGGPLVNSAGQVIGMDTAASSGFSFQSGGTQGFAIPVSQAVPTARQIEAGNGSSVVHIGATAFLGVQLSSSGQGSRGGGFGGGNGGTGGTGAVVAGLVPGGAAEQAGLAVNDVITSLAGQTVTSSEDVARILVGYHPGNSVKIGWTDTQGQSHTATVSLGSGPPA